MRKDLAKILAASLIVVTSVLFLTSFILDRIMPDL